MVVNIPHPQNQRFKVIASPIKLSGTPVEYHHAPPQLGEHTYKILKRYKSNDQLNQFNEKGIIEDKTGEYSKEKAYVD